ncbi:MAG: prepilin-type N-terminal cleavage/methylation domain-containing protein [Limisphaerales bacterium]
MKVCNSDKWQVTRDEIPVSCARHDACHSSPANRQLSAFTLIEMLVVIAIAGLIAALAVPALKSLGKSNVTVSAARQLLDDVGRARQLAMSQRTTVYMAFVPTNFWTIPPPDLTTWLNTLTPQARTSVTNLVDKQLTGYIFISQGTVGDQPGRHNWRYLAPWQSLPDGVFIAAQKFMLPGNPSLPYKIEPWRANFSISPFTNVYLPFPTETNLPPNYPLVALPCIAFDYSGRLISEVDNSGNYRDAYIPLVKGNVSYGSDPKTKLPQFTAVNPADIHEAPIGNSTDISYNVIHIDALTGRAVLEFYKVP